MTATLVRKSLRQSILPFPTTNRALCIGRSISYILRNRGGNNGVKGLLNNNVEEDPIAIAEPMLMGRDATTLTTLFNIVSRKLTAPVSLTMIASNANLSREPAGITHVSADVERLVKECAIGLEKELEINHVYPGNGFIKPGTASKVLTDDRIRQLFRTLFSKIQDNRRSWVEKRLEQLIHNINQYELQTILAILIYLRCGQESLGLFEHHAFRQDTTGQFSGLKLPFNMTTSKKYFKSFGKKFHDAQYIFIPFIVSEGKENKCTDPKIRMPLLSQEIIGQGAHGLVNKLVVSGGCYNRNGKFSNKDEIFAQKIFRNSKQGNFKFGNREENKQAFEREKNIHFQIMKGIPHENVVRCFGSLESPDQDSLLFELGEATLADVLRNEKLPRIQAGVVFERAAAMCEGLHYLHFGLFDLKGLKRLYHLDISPDNILICLEKWKIADLGLSAEIKIELAGFEELKQVKARRGGTYISPEEILSRKASEASDMWSLAAIIIEVITYVVGGPPLVEIFRKRRLTQGEHGEDDRFFTTSTEQGQQKAIVKKRVIQWCQTLPEKVARENKVLRDAVDDSLQFVLQIMVVDARLRTTTAGHLATQLSLLAARLGTSRPTKDIKAGATTPNDLLPSARPRL